MARFILHKTEACIHNTYYWLTIVIFHVTPNLHIYNSEVNIMLDNVPGQYYPAILMYQALSRQYAAPQLCLVLFTFVITDQTDRGQTDDGINMYCCPRSSDWPWWILLTTLFSWHGPLLNTTTVNDCKQLEYICTWTDRVLDPSISTGISVRTYWLDTNCLLVYR